MFKCLIISISVLDKTAAMDAVDSISLILNNINEPVNFSEYEDEILKPLTYLRTKPHKWIGIFVAALKHWFDIPKDKAKLIQEIQELITELPVM